MDIGFNHDARISMDAVRRNSEGPATVEAKRAKYKVNFKKFFNSVSNLFKPKNKNKEDQISAQVKVISATASESGRGANEIFKSNIRSSLENERSSASEKTPTKEILHLALNNNLSADSSSELSLTSKSEMTEDLIYNLNLFQLTESEQKQLEKISHYLASKNDKTHVEIIKLMRENPALFILHEITSKKHLKSQDKNLKLQEDALRLYSAIALSYKQLGISTKQLFSDIILFLKTYHVGNVHKEQVQNILLTVVVEWLSHGLFASEIEDVREELHFIKAMFPNHPKTLKIIELEEIIQTEKSLDETPLSKEFYKSYKKQILQNYEEYQKQAKEKVKLNDLEPDPELASAKIKENYFLILKKSTATLEKALQTILLSTSFPKLENGGLSSFKKLISSLFQNSTVSKNTSINKYLHEIGVFCLNQCLDGAAYALYQTLPKTSLKNKYISEARKLLKEELKSSKLSQDAFSRATLGTLELIKKIDLIDEEKGMPSINLKLILQYDTLLKDFISQKKLA